VRGEGPDRRPSTGSGGDNHDVAAGVYVEQQRVRAGVGIDMVVAVPDVPGELIGVGGAIIRITGATSD